MPNLKSEIWQQRPFELWQHKNNSNKIQQQAQNITSIQLCRSSVIALGLLIYYDAFAAKISTLFRV